MPKGVVAYFTNGRRIMKRFCLVAVFVIAAGIMLSSCSSGGGGGTNNNGNVQLTGTVRISATANQ